LISSKKIVAVLGYKGFVGENIARALRESDKYKLLPISRQDSLDEINTADIVIHSANPAKRFNAENDPKKDFEETVLKTYNFLELSKNKKFVLISSMSARTQLYTNYGRNRKSCELLAEKNNSLIIRLGPMFGGNRKQDMLHDILSNKDVYVSEDTLYSYADVSWVGNQIVNLLEGCVGIKEIGARNYVKLGDIKNYFNSTSKFLGKNENQITQNCDYGPDANDVYEYAKTEFESMSTWIQQ
jgi:nucleoside-diphosphate-sugar epimerase